MFADPVFHAMKGFEASEKDKIGKAYSSFCALTSIKSPEEKWDCQWQFGNCISEVITSQFSELETSWAVGERQRGKADLIRSSECISERPRGAFSIVKLPFMEVHSPNPF